MRAKKRIKKSVGKLSDSIDHMEMEETPIGVKVIVYYKHYYLDDPLLTKAEINIPKKSDDGEVRYSISEYMFEIGILLGLENSKTLDWKLTKEIPDDYLADHPECKESNPLAVATAPGRSFWRVDSYR